MVVGSAAARRAADVFVDTVIAITFKIAATSVVKLVGSTF